MSNTEETRQYLHLNAPKLYKLASDNYTTIKKQNEPFELLNESCLHSEALICIIFSFMSFEGFINELPLLIEYYFKENEEKPKFAEKLIICIKQFESSNASINLKLSMIHKLIFEKGYEKDRQVYQKFNELLILRNEITHLKAKDYFSIHNDGELEYRTSNIITKLTAAGIIDEKHTYENQLLQEELPLPFIELISKKKVAEWACNTICETIDELVNSMPESELKTYIAKYVSEYWKKV